MSLTTSYQNYFSQLQTSKVSGF